MDQPANGVELEAQPRKIGGYYLRNIPGLTPQRLQELYHGVLIATGDAHAQAAVTYFAAGGMRIQIGWTQANMPQKYDAILPAERVAAVLDKDEDTLFTEFATETLEAVRALSLAIERDPSTPRAEVKFGSMVRAAAGKFAGFLGLRQAERTVDERTPEPADLSNDELADKLRAQLAPSPGPWTAQKEAVRPMDVVVWAGSAWRLTGEVRRFCDTELGKQGHTLQAHDATIEGILRRVWLPIPHDELVAGEVGYTDALKPAYKLGDVVRLRTQPQFVGKVVGLPEPGVVDVLFEGDLGGGGHPERVEPWMIEPNPASDGTTPKEK